MNWDKAFARLLTKRGLLLVSMFIFKDAVPEWVSAVLANIPA